MIRLIQVRALLVPLQPFFILFISFFSPTLGRENGALFHACFVLFLILIPRLRRSLIPSPHWLHGQLSIIYRLELRSRCAMKLWWSRVRHSLLWSNSNYLLATDASVRADGTSRHRSPPDQFSRTDPPPNTRPLLSLNWFLLILVTFICHHDGIPSVLTHLTQIKTLLFCFCLSKYV